DTATVSIKRILKGKSPFIGGKDHTTHHLAYLGLSEKQVALLITFLSAVSVALGTICLNIHQWTHAYTAIFVAYFVILFTVLFTIANITKDKSNHTESQVNGEVK
ncbi:MAG TPA: hypothetical protein PKN41_12985, partial [Bacteroidales bacterium]|nr:hypothetical protein [Bacteroidales bacterium]